MARNGQAQRRHKRPATELTIQPQLLLDVPQIKRGRINGDVHDVANFLGGPALNDTSFRVSISRLPRQEVAAAGC
jgi:hypothetical protein